MPDDAILYHAPAELAESTGTPPVQLNQAPAEVVVERPTALETIDLLHAPAEIALEAPIPLQSLVIEHAPIETVWGRRHKVIPHQFTISAEDVNGCLGHQAYAMNVTVDSNVLYLHQAPIEVVYQKL